MTFVSATQTGEDTSLREPEEHPLTPAEAFLRALHPQDTPGVTELRVLGIGGTS